MWTSVQMISMDVNKGASTLMVHTNANVTMVINSEMIEKPVWN